MKPPYIFTKGHTSYVASNVGYANSTSWEYYYVSLSQRMNLHDYSIVRRFCVPLMVGSPSNFPSDAGLTLQPLTNHRPMLLSFV